MSGDTVQVHYEQLAEAGRRFAQQAESCSQLSQRLAGPLHELENGGWDGEGSVAFLSEMNDEMMPAVARLAGALAHGEQVTLKVAQLFREAEEDASRGSPGNGPGAVSSPGGVAGHAEGRPAATGTGEESIFSKLPPWMQPTAKDRAKAAREGASKLISQGYSGRNELKSWMELRDKARSGGWWNALKQTTRKNLFGQMGVKQGLGAGTTIIGEAYSGYKEYEKLVDQGVNEASALSRSAGKATTSTLIKLAASSNPITGSLVLLDEVLGTEVVGTVSEHAGIAADKASTWLADVAYDEEEGARDYRRQHAVQEYNYWKRFGMEKMPYQKAVDVYRGLADRDAGRARAFWSEYSTKQQHVGIMSEWLRPYHLATDGAPEFGDVERSWQAQEDSIYMMMADD